MFKRDAADTRPVPGRPAGSPPLSSSLSLENPLPIGRRALFLSPSLFQAAAAFNRHVTRHAQNFSYNSRIAVGACPDPFVPAAAGLSPLSIDVSSFRVDRAYGESCESLNKLGARDRTSSRTADDRVFLFFLFSFISSSSLRPMSREQRYFMGLIDDGK